MYDPAEYTGAVLKLTLDTAQDVLATAAPVAIGVVESVCENTCSDTDVVAAEADEVWYANEMLLAVHPASVAGRRHV